MLAHYRRCSSRIAGLGTLKRGMLQDSRLVRQYMQMIEHGAARARIPRPTAGFRLLGYGVRRATGAHRLAKDPRYCAVPDVVHTIAFKDCRRGFRIACRSVACEEIDDLPRRWHRPSSGKAPAAASVRRAFPPA